MYSSDHVSQKEPTKEVTFHHGVKQSKEASKSMIGALNLPKGQRLNYGELRGINLFEVSNSYVS